MTVLLNKPRGRFLTTHSLEAAERILASKGWNLCEVGEYYGEDECHYYAIKKGVTIEKGLYIISKRIRRI